MSDLGNPKLAPPFPNAKAIRERRSVIATARSVRPSMREGCSYMIELETDDGIIEYNLDYRASIFLAAALSNYLNLFQDSAAGGTPSSDAEKPRD